MTRSVLHAALFVVLSLLSRAAEPPELTALQQQYAFLVAERVTTPYETGIEALNAKFLAALAAAGETARSAGRLPEVLAMEDDKKRIAGKQGVPDKDDEATPEPLKKLRAVYRTEAARLAQQRTSAHAALLPAYSTNLKNLEVTLTKANRLDEAKAVMQYRESLAVPGAPVLPGKEHINSLGMKFVKVPDTGVLMCIHETRRKDYAVYAGDVPGVGGAWKAVVKDGVPSSDKDDHPVANIHWDEAQGFCQWLAKREGRGYRLPTDREWSCAIGLANVEKWTPATTPEMLNGKVKDEFPWNGAFPPKGRGLGNYADTDWKTKFPASACIEGYTDGFPTSAPVMSFKPNKLGIFDLGGNVWEWIADPFSASTTQHTLRGGSWDSVLVSHLLSSARIRNPNRRHDYGFRVVLEEKAP
ncbi:MAG: SUMF1/EgtB/PvdO family nonheme iron enzyme [Verrucomicrobiaceae bacterium]|jgi:formylglycine-generating enzyme required for sulfatase activity|nr:SUMF1/EgtB/PvdO family nonheme iron enzyme [Verrucomicrobiaceae bacterium]